MGFAEKNFSLRIMYAVLEDRETSFLSVAKHWAIGKLNIVAPFHSEGTLRTENV